MTGSELPWQLVAMLLAVDRLANFILSFCAVAAWAFHTLIKPLQPHGGRKSGADQDAE